MLLTLHLHLLYIGPGMGAGTFAVIIGVLASFALSMIAIVWYPLKKFIRYLRSKSGKK